MYTYLPLSLSLSIYIYIYVYIHICIYIYIHTYVYTISTILAEDFGSSPPTKCPRGHLPPTPPLPPCCPTITPRDCTAMDLLGRSEEPTRAEESIMLYCIILYHIML